ncbi:MAG: alpha/beta hydrolase [Cytophagales bacterium]|jgi:pimeloyl-ACP methyl ester carboxylesterase|nr:alpha/beta hydrolase [Cytophagales bacterium]
MLKRQGEYNFFETEGRRGGIILLHGLLGKLSNWEHVVEKFGDEYKIFVPLLPLDTIDLKKANVECLAEFVKNFVAVVVQDSNVYALIGNSLGGHLALLCVIKNLFTVEKLVLTGSSGLYEKKVSVPVFRRHDKEFIRNVAKQTFFDENFLTDEYLDEIFASIQDNSKVLRLLHISRSSQKNRLDSQLSQIKIPTLLIWGQEDSITLPESAHQFNNLIPNSQLYFIERCGHAPMWEQPEKI